MKYNWEQIKSKVKEVKRVAFDLGLFICNIMLLKLFEADSLGSFSVQFICYKALLVNGGFLHAHITRKLCFEKIDWANDSQKMLKLLAIVIYAVIIMGWSRGG